MRKVRLLSIIFMTIFILGNKKNQFSDNFSVALYNEYYRVISPAKFQKETTVVVENQTLSNIVGKVVQESKDEYKESFLTLRPKKFRAINVKFTRSNKVYFVPMAPSLQIIEFKFGKGSYEVPPQNKRYSKKNLSNL